MMEKFENEINKLNKDEEFTTWLSAEEDAKKVNNTLINNAKEEGFEDGFKEGESSGKQENKKETARKMLDDKLDISLISKYTSLSEDDIMALKDSK